MSTKRDIYKKTVRFRCHDTFNIIIQKETSGIMFFV